MAFSWILWQFSTGCIYFIIMTTKDTIRKKLKEIRDPELDVNIVDLGLVYDTKFVNGLAIVTMTLTTPGCPLSSVFETMIKTKLKKIDGVKKVKIDLVFNPSWSPSKINPETRAALGL